MSRLAKACLVFLVCLVVLVGGSVGGYELYVANSANYLDSFGRFASRYDTRLSLPLGESTSDFYRSTLSEADAKLYDDFVYCIYNQHESFSVKNTNPESLKYIYTCVIQDYTEIFWVENYAYTLDSNGIVNRVYPHYSLELSERLEQYEQLHERAQLIADMASPLSGEYEQALFVHDYLVQYGDYDDTLHGVLSFDARGLLFGQNAVCAGYARTYSLVLQKLGIDSIYVTGVINEASTGHAWNLVCIDGQYTLIDVTYDDAEFKLNDGTVVCHAYFGLRMQDLSDERTAQALPAPYPETVDMNYHAKQGLYVTDLSSQVLALASRLAENVRNGFFGLELRFPNQSAAQAATDGYYPLGRVISAANDLLRRQGAKERIASRFTSGLAGANTLVVFFEAA